MCYTYSGHGRLIRKQTPVRGELLGNQTHVRSERYYYDGARRIQEVVGTFTPATSGGSGGGSGGSGGTQEPFEALGISNEIGSVTGEWNPGLNVHDLRVDREYVYVPSAAGGYVDEFIGQFDRYGDPWWILQDANYNVLVMTDADGDVARQVMYDPYGEPLFAEDFGAHPGLKVGHQGLFFDRLEPPAAVSGSISIGGATQLQPGVFGLYQARNRVLLSRYGRWAQADPNGTGLLTSVQWKRKSYSPMIAVDTPSFDMTPVDGSNRFAFVGGDPANRTDPNGLFGFVQGLMTGLNMFDTMTDVMDQAEQGVRLGAQYTRTITDYAFDQMIMVDWALDWNASDRDLGLVENRYATRSDIGIDSGSQFAVGGSRSWADAPMPLPPRKGHKRHHIATHYGPAGYEFKQIFDTAGMDLNHIQNFEYVLNIHHVGGHTKKYRMAVLRDLTNAVERASRGVSDADILMSRRRNAILQTLDVWAERIRMDPGIMYR